MVIKSKLLAFLVILLAVSNIILAGSLKKAIEKMSEVKEPPCSYTLNQLFEEKPEQTVYYYGDKGIYSFTPRRDGSFVLRKVGKK